MKTTRVFISQPMNGLTDEEIEDVRNEAIHWVETEMSLNGPFEFVDSNIKEDPPEMAALDREGVWYLGKSLELMATASLVVFCDGWDEARGCIFEHEVARLYHLPCVDLSEPRINV